MNKERWNLLRILVCAAMMVPILVLEYTQDAAWAHYTVLGLSIAAFLLIGYDVLLKSFRRIIHGQFLEESFLMTIAAAGAFAIGEYPEAVAVMLFFQIGEFCEHRAVRRSRRSIRALLSINPDTAVVVRDGVEQTVSPDSISIGEVIVVRAGERIALDGIVTDGAGNLDMSSLNGESMPRYVSVGTEVHSGAIVLDSVLHIAVTKPYAESTASRMIRMVETARENKAPVENFITTFAKYYTPVVVGIACVVGILVPLCIRYNDWPTWAFWLKKAMIFLVVSCPCALVISVPLSYFGAIGLAGRLGILIKGGHIFAAVTRTDCVVMDKTGTITEGRFSVAEICPAANSGLILRYAAICEQGSLHPIAQSIMAVAPDAPADGYQINEVRGQGIRADGAHTILCGNRSMLEAGQIQIPADIDPDGTVVYVGVDAQYLGYIRIADTVRSDSVQAIAELRRQGVKTVMLSGDTPAVARQVAEAVRLDEWHGGLLPEQKVDAVADLRKEHTVAFVGDGINDAPVIASADIGIAMGGIGSDAAIESADVVLMNDSLTQIVSLRNIASKTQRIVKENIIFALGVKVGVMVLSMTAFSQSVAMMWLAVAADVGVAILAILNAMRAGTKRNN